VNSPAAKTPGPLLAWLLATRPKTLPAAVVPVLVGVGCSLHAGQIRWLPSLAALVGALLLQIGSNFANDVYDYEKGADTDARVGPTRAVAAGWISPASMKRGMWVIFAAALLVGGYLTWAAGPVIIAIGLTSIVAAIAYTAGPYPLGYNGLGELFVMIFFGFVAVCGTHYVNLGTVSALALACSIPVGALASAILVVNNVRDESTDRQSGKRTLVVRFGRRVGIGEYAVLLSLAYAIPMVLVIAQWTSPVVLLPWLSAPLALALARRVATQTGPVLNASLARTAQLLLVFGVLLSAGLVWSSSRVAL
jgi:1,4-dihydroxy-2-naphthoate octaprenyltransferase